MNIIIIFSINIIIVIIIIITKDIIITISNDVVFSFDFFNLSHLADWNDDQAVHVPYGIVRVLLYVA